MIRKTLAILSLIGFIASLGAWAASYYGIEYQRDVWGRRDALSGWYTLFNGNFTYWHSIPLFWGEAELSSSALVEESVDGEWHFGEDKIFIRGLSSTAWQLPYLSGDIIVMPLWATSSGCLALSVVVVLAPRYRRRRHRKLGLCIHCGYDLRGSIDRCPECATPFDAKLLPQVVTPGRKQ